MADLTFVLQYLLLAIISSFAVLALYRRCYHPLARFPGPWLNSLTEVPCALVLLSGTQHAYYRRLHDHYGIDWMQSYGPLMMTGPVVRIAPNELSFIAADAWEAIYGVRKNGPSMEKSPIFIGAVSPLNGQTGISLAPNEIHTRQRRALAYSFTNAALLQQEEIMLTHVRKLVKALKTKAAVKQSVNFSNWFTYTTFDMIGDLCFAEPFGCLDEEGATDWSTSVINVFRSATWDQAIRRVAGVNSVWQKLLVKLLIPVDAAKWRRTHFANSQEKTMRRLAKTSLEHKDFIYHILQNKEAKKSLSEVEIILNMVLIISAGSETTASLLTGWVWLICTHPLVYKRVTEEVRSTVANEEDINWHTAKQLTYLEATMSEALRLFSPAPANQQRIVPRGGATIDGHFVPEGTTVAVAPWAAVHSTLNFTDPERFDPERWLGSKHYVNDKLHASQPFSLGPRGCIGKNVSYFEMRLIMTFLLWNFDMALVQNGQHGQENKLWDFKDNMKHIKVFQTWVKPGLWVDLNAVSR